MSNENVQYFLVTGGAVQAAIERFFVERNKAWDARQSFCEEIGAQNLYGNNLRVTGACFVDGKTPPKGWQRVRTPNGDYWKPTRRSAAGKKMIERMCALRMPTARDLTDEIIGEDSLLYFVDYDQGLMAMGCEKLCGKWVITVPLVPDEERANAEPGTEPYKAKWTPPDEHCRLLKKSEYWSLVEEHVSHQATENARKLCETMNRTPVTSTPTPVAQP